MKKAFQYTTLVALAFCAGCNFFNPTPPDSAVLDGEWDMVFDEPGDLEGLTITATFDANGDLTEISASNEAGGTATLTLDSAVTELDGDQVTITIPTSGGSVNFEGTLSADENTIDGQFSQSFELPGGDLDVTLPTGAVTLTRITD